MRELREEIEALKRALEEQKLRAQRDALATEVERGAGGVRRSNNEGSYIVSCCANIWAGNPNRHVATHYFPSD